MENLQTASRGLADQRGYHGAWDADDASAELHVTKPTCGDLQVHSLHVDAQKVGGLLDRQHLRVSGRATPGAFSSSWTIRRPGAQRRSDENVRRRVVIR